jgi:hypothetical protein
MCSTCGLQDWERIKRVQAVIDATFGDQRAMERVLSEARERIGRNGPQYDSY